MRKAGPGIDAQGDGLAAFRRASKIDFSGTGVGDGIAGVHAAAANGVSLDLVVPAVNGIGGSSPPPHSAPTQARPFKES